MTKDYFKNNFDKALNLCYDTVKAMEEEAGEKMAQVNMRLVTLYLYDSERNLHPKVQVRYKFDKTTGNGHLEYGHSFCLDEEKDPWETAVFEEVKMEDIGDQLDFVSGSLSRLVEDWNLGENYELNWLGD